MVTYEGMVEGGQVRLPAEARLPDRTRAYVLVPEAPPPPIPRLASPRLVVREKIADFRMEIDHAGPVP